MTEEQSLKNRKAYLELIDNFWEFDDESRAYIENRISDNWNPCPEIKNLISTAKEYDGDQRIIWSFEDFEANDGSSDQGYRLFKSSFQNALSCLREQGINITYKEYQNNKVMFKGNLTKLKKVFEVFYKENDRYSSADLGVMADTTAIAQAITSKYERIGTYKKPSTKLKMVLSFNPIDWMLASTASSISSCLNLENSGGGYKFFGGLPFLCGDPNRAMLYFSKGEMKEYRGMTVENPLTRSWVIMDKNKKLQIIKWYANEYYSLEQISRIVENKVPFGYGNGVGKALYEIEPLYLKNGLFFTIFNDNGKYVKKVENGKIKSFVLDGGYGKGGFQLFHKTGIDLTEGNNFYYERPSPLREKTNFRIDDFERTGLTFNNIPHKIRCPRCHEEKIFLTLNSEDGEGKTQTICFDCARDKSFVCDCCGHIKFSEPKEAEFVEGSLIVKKKICARCYSNTKRCACCGRFVSDSHSYVSDERRNVVCIHCINDTTLGYHKCHTCGVYTKSAKLSFDYDDETFKWQCSNHLGLLSENDFSNKFAYYKGDIYVSCNKCKNITLNKTTGHCEYCDSIINGKQFII